MQFSLPRGLRLMLLLGLNMMIVASCSPASQPTTLDTGMSPRSYHYTPNSTEIPNKTKSESASISSNQSPSSPQEAYTSLMDQPFDRTLLQLKGITLDHTASDIIQIWGEPLSYMVMGDYDPIRVMEYDGFSVGCNQKGQVVFVEVSSRTITSGIEGVHVGGQGLIVKQSLGDPDQDSGYVWRYINDHVSLRIDLDPKTSIVQSIKLLPYHYENA